MILQFQFLSWWQVGTGAGRAGQFDSRAARDPDGLPVIPGKQVKGLCREAMREAEAYGDAMCAACARYAIPAGSTVSLFGTRAPEGRHLLTDPTIAKLRFSDARLPDATRAAILASPALADELFAALRSTAMQASGTALPHSLRTDEVVVPLKLEAMVEPVGVAPIGWEDHLSFVLPLIEAAGSGRTRGLGRVIVTRANP